MTKPSVTRIEIADCVGDAFLKGRASRSELLERATAANARPELLAILASLPDGTYPALRELWRPLAHIPIEPAQEA